MKAFPKASAPRQMLGAHSGARQDWGTGGAQSASPLWQHQTDLSLQQPELIAESSASWGSHLSSSSL